MPLPLRDIVRCPECGSRDVVYSCEPKCCFNHVCADCKTTFQITTEKAGRDDPSVGEVSRPESGDPTTSCCVCHSLRVGVISAEQGPPQLICGDCKAVLTLQYEDVVSGRVVPG
jgi:DNA-directed RNA polymerase subunit RPC12/RpoP